MFKRKTTPRSAYGFNGPLADYTMNDMLALPAQLPAEREAGDGDWFGPVGISAVAQNFYKKKQKELLIQKEFNNIAFQKKTPHQNKNC